MFTLKDKIYFYDCDPAGILFYANIFKIAHKCYEEFLSDISDVRNFFFDDSVLLPIIHSEADYFNPLSAGEDIVINVFASVVKESSFELTYKLLRGGETCIIAKTVHVAVDKKSFAKTKLPEELKTKLFENSEK
jgi:YbgC/YbaW family acyl-CoA thioester hydrolase